MGHPSYKFGVEQNLMFWNRLESRHAASLQLLFPLLVSENDITQLTLDRIVWESHTLVVKPSSQHINSHLDNWSVESLVEAGIADIDQAFRLSLLLAGRGVTDDDLSTLLNRLPANLYESSDPDGALQAFSRWFSAVGNPKAHLQLLESHPVALLLFLRITGSSRLFADILARQPESFEIIANPDMRKGSRSAASYSKEILQLIDACRLPELKQEALRRWKAREMLQIGVRDLADIASLEVTVRDFSNLADACIQAALKIAISSSPPERLPPFTVIALGKLGGKELNYSSDIDLMFLHGDSLEQELELEDGRKMDSVSWLNRVAEAVIKTLSEEGTHGHVFRVDMRLRPEGRFGPITRSLESCKAYYESWAENWERQALLKARCAAGNRTLGASFMRMIHPFVYSASPSPSLMNDIVQNKRRIERKCAMDGSTERNIKTGRGGIRDIEFLTQKFQLQYGGKIQYLRTPSALMALRRLGHIGIIAQKDCHILISDYIFLRTLEHRLQLLNGMQTQTLPDTGTAERKRLAKRMGYPDAGSFELELEMRRSRTNELLQRYFYNDAPYSPQTEQRSGQWSDMNALLENIELESARSRLSKLLEDSGFMNIDAAIGNLLMPMRGNEYGGMPPDTPVEFQNILAPMMDLITAAPDPDAALSGFEALALAVPNRAQLYASCDDSPQMLMKLIRLAGASPPLMQLLTQNLEWMEGLINPEEEDMNSLLASRLQGLEEERKKIEALIHFHARMRLHIGAAEIWGEYDTIQTMTELTRLADAVLCAILALCDLDSSDLALLGLGKLGGEELGYASDWDAMLIRRESISGDSDSLDRKIGRLPVLVDQMAAGGAPVSLDMRLRPWGSKGALAQTARALYHYHTTAGELWERQAALKSRFICGDMQTGKHALSIINTICYKNEINDEEAETIRAMKKRIETERLQSQYHHTDLKLGWGGLSDIEWLAQLMQMKFGRRIRSLRTPSTMKAIDALAEENLLENSDADTLQAIYLQLTAARNALWLQTGTSQDILPEKPSLIRALARHTGYDLHSNGQEAIADLQNAMGEAREIFQRYFYQDSLNR